MKRVTPREILAEVRSANLLDPPSTLGWGPRLIADPELVLLISGELLQRRNGSEVRVREGEVLFISPGIEHRLEIVDIGKRTVMSCIHFEPLKGARYSDGGLALVPEPEEITDTRGDYSIRDSFTRCARVFHGYSRFREELLSNIFGELWARLCEIWAGGGEGVLSRRMKELLSFVRRNLDSHLSREELARQAGVTPQYLNVLFRRELGVTPLEFVNRERVQRASRLLAEEGLSVKEAAARVGYKDQFYFSRVFKRIMNYPPSQAV